MKTTTVIGAQWGDEGKGKITDYLADIADVIVRFQGGNNAGHTIVINGKKYALHLIPSGIFRQKALNVLAQGMVIDPFALDEEMTMLNNEQIGLDHLVVSQRAHVILPFHKTMDTLIESIRHEKVGTTARGIGPAYTDKAARLGLRMIEFIDPKAFAAYLDTIIPYYNTMFKAHGIDLIDKQTLLKQCAPLQQSLAPYIKDTSTLIHQAIQADKHVLFEGAQGTMLCLEHGTYPFVTSSSPTAASVPINVGIAPSCIDRVIGITKAYTTRVGSGAFPSEINDDIAKTIAIKGHEFGTTTGRRRRIGWLDIVQLKYAHQINGFTDIALTLLDVLSGIDPIKICVGYTLDGEPVDHYPASHAVLKRVKPVYETLPGFHEDITGVRDFASLPKQAQAYMNRIEQLLGVNISIFSVGPDREATVIRTLDDAKGVKI